MYGAVIATSRKLGVRQAPFRLWSTGEQYHALSDWSFSSEFGSAVGGSPHFDVRRSLLEASVSFHRPVHAPDGRQVSSFPTVSQSQLALPATQSARVGT